MNWQSFGSGKTKKSPHMSPKARRLLLEALEDRTVPALLLNAGSQEVLDDPNLLKFPGLKTPFKDDSVIIQVKGTDGLNYLRSVVQAKPNSVLNDAFDFSATRVLWQTDSNTMMRVGLKPEVDPVGVYNAISKFTNVEYVSLNFVYREQEGYGKLDYQPNDPFSGPSLSQQYHHGIIEDYKAWEAIRGTSAAYSDANGNTLGPIVAVTDNGFDINHNDLKNAMWVNPGETPGDGVDNDRNGYIDDYNGVNVTQPYTGQTLEPRGSIVPSNANDDHGTHVAGIIAAQMDNGLLVSGVAGGGIIQADGSTAQTAGARIMGIKWQNTQNNIVSYYESSVIIEGLYYAYDKGADIVSSSYIVISGQAPFQAPFPFADDQGVINAYKNLHDKGIVCLVAAANDGIDNTVALEKLPYVIWVGSTDENDQKSYFSNYGKTVDVMAPGSDILSLAPGNFFQFLSGTSMATPVAAGVVALIMAAHPDWTRDQVVSQLYATANNIDNLNPAYVGDMGHGRVNSFGSVTSSSGFAAVANGQTIIAGADIDGSVKIWTPGGKLQQNIPVTPGVPLTSIVMDGDLRMVVGSADGTITYLSRSAANGAVWFKPVGRYNAGSSIVSVETVRQGTTGIVFAVNAQGEAIKYDFNAKVATVLFSAGMASSLKLNSTQNLLVIALKAGGLTVLDPATLSVVTTIAGDIPITAIDFARGNGNANTLVAGYQDGSVRSWNLGVQPATSFLIGKDTASPVLAITAGDGTTVAYGYAGGQVYARNLTTGAFVNQLIVPLTNVLDGSGKEVKDAAGNPVMESISSLLVVSGGSEIAVATKSREIGRFVLNRVMSQNLGAGNVKAVADNSQGGQFGKAVGLADGTVNFVSGTTVTASITVSSSAIVKLQWNASGDVLGAIDAAGHLYLLYYPGTTGYNLVQVSNAGITSAFTQLAFSADNLSLATATADGKVYEWDLLAAVKVPKFQFVLPASAVYPSGSPGAVNGLVYTPDGKYLATADQGGFARLWNRDPLDTKNRDADGNFAPTFSGTLGTLGDAISPLTAIAASPNGAFIAVGNIKGQAEVYDLSRLKLASRTKGTDRPTVSLGFTDDSQSLLVGNANGLVRLVQTNSGTLLSVVRDSDAALASMSVDSAGSANGLLDFVVGFADGSVEIYKISASNRSRNFLGQGAVPTIGGVDRLPSNGGTTNTVPSDIIVTFDGLFDLSKFNQLGPVRFVGRGPDGIFDTADDSIVRLAPLEGMGIGTNYATFRVVGVLSPDVYQFRISADAAVSPFGTKLDGNGDGVTGDDYLGPVFEYAGASGTIYGRVTAGNQQFSQDSAGLAGRRVFVDLNNNGVFDPVYIPAGEGATKTVVASQVPKAIDNSSPMVAIMDITAANGRAGAITSVIPKLTIKHTYFNDIRGYLESPDGTKISLFSNLPFFSYYLTGLKDIEFRNDPTLPTLSQFIQNNAFSNKQVLTGAVRPDGDLGVFNGQSTFGRWKITIIDDQFLDNGYLQSWSLKFQTSEPTAVQNIVDPNTGLVTYVTSTDVNGYYAIPNMGAGLANFTSVQYNVLLDDKSADQAKFADFNDVFPLNGTRQVTIDNRTASLKNDYQEVLLKPKAVLFNGLTPLLPDVTLDSNNLGALSLDLTPAVALFNGVKGGSYTRGPSFGTVSDKIQIFADANNDNILTPDELVKTVDYANGQTSMKINNALSNAANPLRDGMYNIYAVQVALDRYISAPIKVAQLNLISTPPATPEIVSVSPVLNTIIPTTTPTFTGTSIANAVIQLFLNGGTTVIGSGTSDALGNWSVKLTTPLPQGASSVVAYALDFLGNKSSASAAFGVVVDTVGPKAPTITDIVGAAPNPSIPGAAGVYFAKSSPSKIVVTLAESAVTSVYLDGKLLFRTSQPVGPGSVSINLPAIADNSLGSPYALTVTQTNGFGIEGKASPAALLVVNSTAPAAPTLGGITPDTGRSVTDFITKEGALQLFGTAQYWAKVLVNVDDIFMGTAYAGSLGGWFLIPGNGLFQATEGVHKVTLQAETGSGLLSPVSSPFYFTVDKTAPLVPINVGVAAPFGALPNFTNASTPTITGKGEVNSIVTISDAASGTTLGTGLVDAQGNFSVPLNQNLGQGPKSVKISLTDVAGNASTPLTYAFTVQSAFPAGPVSVGKIALDTGFSDADAITRGLIGSVIGLAPAGTRIRLIADAGTANEINLSPTDADLVATDGTGTWNFLRPLGIPFDEGRHTLTAVAIDKAGNAVSSASFRVIVDFTAPRDTAITSLSSTTGNNDLGFTDQFDFTVGGRAEPFARITLSLGGVQLSDMITVSEKGTWSYKIPAGRITANGTFLLKADTLDAAGNKSIAPSVLEVKVDKAAPTAPQIDGLKGFGGDFDVVTSLDRLVIGGKAPAGTKVQVSLTGQNGVEQDLGLAVADASGRWTLDNSQVLRASGDYTIKAKVIGRTGAVSASSSLAVRVDTVAPNAPQITGFAPGTLVIGQYLGTTAPVVTGTAEPRSRIEIAATAENGDVVHGTAITDDNGKWSVSLSGLGNGPTSLIAQVRDAAGNLSLPSAPLAFTVDTAGPEAAVSSPVKDGVFTPTNWLGEFTGSAPDVGAGTQSVALAIKGPNGLYYDGAKFASDVKIYLAAQGATAWKLAFPASALVSGKIVFTVKSTDNLGNVSESAEQGLTYSSSIPTISDFKLTPNVIAGTFRGVLTFSAPVTGLSLSSFNVTNGTVSDLTGSGAEYEFRIKPTKPGQITVSVKGGAVKDEFGATNPGSEVLVRSYGTSSAFEIAGGVGSRPVVRVVSNMGVARDYQVFESAFRGGVRAALADFNNDGIADVVAVPGPGGGPVLRVFDGLTGNLLKSMYVFAGNYTRGLYVAVGDTNGDGTEDIIVSTGGGGTAQVKAISGKDFKTVLTSFAPYGGFAGEVTVAVANIKGDAAAEIVTGTGAGVRPDVRVWSGKGKFIQAVAVSANAGLAGVFVAAADLSGDGLAEVIIGTGFGVSSQVYVNNLNASPGTPALRTMAPFAPGFKGGARVGAADVDGDGDLDLVVGSGNGVAVAKRFDGLSLGLIDQVFLEGNITGGVYV